MMAKAVYGVFDTSAEVLSAIQTLQAKGYNSYDMTVVADKEESWDVPDLYRRANVQTISDGDRDDSFLDKVKRFFTGDEHDGLRDRLYTLGLTEQDTDTYWEDLRQGRFLILVDDDKGIMNNLVTEEGRTSYAEAAAASELLVEEDTSRNTLTDDLFTPDPVTTEVTTPYSAVGESVPIRPDVEDEQTLRLREEQLKVDKEAVQAGEVVVHKNVVEEQQTINVPVEHEEVYVERRPVTGDQADALPIDGEETIRIPVTEERIEVTKKPVVTEEIVVGKRTVQETERVQDTVRKETVDVDQNGNPIVRETNTNR